MSSRYRQGWYVELTFERTGTEKTQGDIVSGCSSNSCYGRKVGRGKCLSSGICLELCKSLDFSVRWKFCQIKRKKKMFSLNQSDSVVVVIFGEPKNWRKKLTY